VHCSIWTFEGDPDTLVASYEAMLAHVPAENMRLSACAKTPTGIVLFDTCPSKEAFDAFFASEDVRALFAAHGLDQPASVENFPVVAAFAHGSRIDRES
jgi:hypothetical protein